MIATHQLDPQIAVERIYRAEPRKPQSHCDRRGDLLLADLRIDDDEKKGAHRMVLRLANRHDCQAPARLRTLLQTASRPGPFAGCAAALAAVAAFFPQVLCDDDRHTTDITYARTALQLLGLIERCSTCGLWLPVESFAGQPDRGKPVCKACHDTDSEAKQSRMLRTRPMITCSCCGKRKPHFGHGRCEACNARWRKAGCPPEGPPPPPLPAAQLSAQRAKERMRRYAELRAQGYSRTDAAREVGVTRKTTYDYDRRLQEEREEGKAQ